MDIKQKIGSLLQPKTQGGGLKKGILGVAIVVLLGALGMEFGNFDLDLGKLMDGASMDEARTYTTWNGQTCKENQYNCGDFKTQGEAQSYFEQCGGLGNDVSGLDRDGDGVACQDLPKESKE